MGVCPNKNLPEWKKLVASKGEKEAHYLWARYNGEVPAKEYLDPIIDDGFGTPEVEDVPNKLNDKYTHDILQEMTFLMLNELIKTDQDLFNIQKLDSAALYEKLKTGVLAAIESKNVAYNNLLKSGQTLTNGQKQILLDRIKNNRELQIDVLVDWPRLIDKHKERIKVYNIEFDENDVLQISEEDKIKESNRFDATKIDSFRKANAAIKLLLASNPIVDNNGKAVRSASINGHLLVPVSQSYITLMNKLHTATSIEEMLERLRNLAIEDPTYQMLYTRLTRRSVADAGVDLRAIDTTHGVQLISGLWKTFKKQNPEVKNVFIFENGEVSVGDAALSSAALQLRSDYLNSIATLAKGGKGFFTYNEKDRKYISQKRRASAVKLTNATEMVKFLADVGIPFTINEYNRLNPSNKKQFATTVSGIRQSIIDAPPISTFSKKSLDLNKRLLEMGILKTAASNPEFSSTYFNLQGERVQTSIGTNAVSELHDVLSKINKLDDLAGTQYEYLLKDVFAQGSNLLSRMFTSDGKKKAGANELLKGGYVGGIIDEIKNKQTPSSKLTQKQRLVQEINLNLKGYFMNLVPGDAAIEHMTYMGNPISTEDLTRGLADVNEIFKGYFLSELELSREDRPVAKNRDSKDLRFFKGILGEKLHNEIITTEGTPEEVYAIHETSINNAISEFIERDVDRFTSELISYKILESFIEPKTGEVKISTELLDLPRIMDMKQFDREMKAISANYMIANIEMHKVLYSDPYQYSDELKRIKSFLSPRQAIVSNSPKMNAAYNRIWNKGYSKEGDVGYTDFTRDYMRTASHQDVVGIIDLLNYGQFDETDGGGTISDRAYRNFRIRAADWNENEEKQYRYDVAWEKRDKGLTLSADEVSLLNEGNPQVQSAYKSLKPIVSGSKLDKNGNPSSWNNIVLDKYALYPLSYRVMKELGADNGVKLYDKMQREDIDYIVFESGRKVGAENSHATYNEDGSFNDAEYESVVNVPLSIMSLQTEVPSKEVALVTRGSQTTKLITMDYMDNGVPFDYTGGFEKWTNLSEEEREASSPIYKEIAHNQRLLEEMTNQGYDMMLKRLGIKEEDERFVVVDNSEAAKTLRDEILRRETNDNIADALTAFVDGKAFLETTPAYQAVRNILYSIVDKQIVSPKISGSMKVQIPSALFESNRVAETEINGKKGYTSDVLKFYENKDGERVMEIMVGRWFQSDMSDEELLTYLNDTPEGQKILSGLAFRIPTQSQNSIDAFRIKKFLPKEFGDNVVVPAAIVKKVGSDFDIDKLSIYLKNTYKEDGKLKLVPFYGFGQQAKDKFAAMFDSGKLFNKEQRRQLKDLQGLKQYNLFGALNAAQGEKFNSLLDALGVSQDEDALAILVEELKKDGVRDAVVNRMYKQSLENEFIQSSENLVTNPANFERLITPNDATQLKDIAKIVADKTTGGSFDYTAVANLLDRRFMSRLRQAFVSGKQAIGIAAVNQTNHSLNQRSAIYVDTRKLDQVDPDDAKFLGDGEIKFANYNKVTIDGNEYASLSGVRNADGQLISNILGQFIDGYVDISKGPWIMEMGAKPNVASTFMFLVKMGVPVDQVAYFMNQPIIRDYLKQIETAGYKFLFIDSFVSDIIDSYTLDKPGKVDDIDTIPSTSSLLDTLGKRRENLTAQEAYNQQFMLMEFLKYAKMANQLYTVTQGTNWDTSNFNDPFLVFKKNLQLAKARNSLISSADDILNSSFIGNLANKVNDSRDAMSNFLLSDRGAVRAVLEQVLMPYVDLPNKTFVKVARKAVNDLFDWAVQTDQGLNLQLQSTLLAKDGVASEVVNFITNVRKDPNHALRNNHVLSILEVKASPRAGNTPINVTLANKDNKAYDQNEIIYSFRELRDYLKGETDLYDKLVTLSVLQSGLGNSPISFTSLIPFEDVSRIYNKTLYKMESLSNLNDFYELGIFQRNNWKDDDIVSSSSLRLLQDRNGKYYYPSLEFYGYNNLRNAMKSGEIPQLVSGLGSEEYQVATWIDLKIPTAERAKMRKAGDYSYVKKGLFKKVYDADGVPLMTQDKRGNYYTVHKAINALGDSFRANEFYSFAKESIIDNGMIKVENEVMDAQIVPLAVATKGKGKGAVEGPLAITIEGKFVVVKDASGKSRKFDSSIVTAEKLVKAGYTSEQAGEIINAKCKG